MMLTAIHTHLSVTHCEKDGLSIIVPKLEIGRLIASFLLVARLPVRDSHQVSVL